MERCAISTSVAFFGAGFYHRACAARERGHPTMTPRAPSFPRRPHPPSRRARRHPVLALIALLAACDRPDTGGTATTSPTAPIAARAANARADDGDTSYPRIVVGPPAGTLQVALAVTFEGQPLSGTIELDAAVVAGARASQRFASYPANRRPPDLEERLQRAFVDDPAQEPAYTAVLGATREWRSRLDLDGDRYLELLAALVQQMPYDPAAGDGRFPIEALADQRGDCDEKSRLLAGLLAREGYAVALLGFPEQNHMAVGIRAADIAYRACGYAILESTSPTLPGQTFAERKSLQLTGDPEVVRIGRGEREYRAGGDLTAIESERRALEQRADIARSAIAAARASVAAVAREAETLRAEVERLQRCGDTAAANATIDRYNAAVRRHGAAVAAANAAIERSNALATACNDVNAASASRRLLLDRLRAAPK